MISNTMSKYQLLIYGAGAIGRGYIPWVFPPHQYDYYYVESNTILRNLLQERGFFTTYMTVDGEYQKQIIEVKGCCALGQEQAWIKEIDAIITAVGPRSFSKLKSSFAGLKIPILCCENDATLPERMRKWSGNNNIVFVIPDVITSSTASNDLLDKDPLAIITESGECFIDSVMMPQLPGACSYVNERDLTHQWLAKLYVHNTPHCIAAYLGSLLDLKYLHEAMEYQSIATIVEGAMNEMVAMLSARSDLSPSFLASYRDKELARFRNQLLYDPIARVAREPFRKLEPKDRLLGAAQLCLAAGVVPRFILVGIMAAFYYDRIEDPDSHITHLRRSMRPEEFLRTIFKLRESEALFILLIEQWDSMLNMLENLKNE